MSCGLHDVLGFEGLGRPAVLVGTSVFEQAATDQAAKLGAPGVHRVFVEHPVQDRTDDELREKAREVLAAVESALAA